MPVPLYVETRWAIPRLGPMVFSEVYGLKNHWDLEFIFTGERSESVFHHSAWRELGFIDVDRLSREDFACSREDILARIRRWKGG